MMAARERLCDFFAVVGPKEDDLENGIVQEAYSIDNLHRYVTGVEEEYTTSVVISLWYEYVVFFFTF